VQHTLAEVDPSSLDRWLDDFKHDMNADRELSVYEGIARAYDAYITANPALGRAARMDVYSLLLVRSGTTEKDALARATLHVLGEKQAREALRLYTEPPHPIRVEVK